MQRQTTAKLLLTAAFVFVLGYFGVDKFAHPLIWIGWIPSWIDGLFTLPRETWLQIIGSFEVLLALLLLMPIRAVRQTGTILIALHFTGILTQVGWNDIAIRDIGLLLADIALLSLI